MQETPHKYGLFFYFIFIRAIHFWKLRYLLFNINQSTFLRKEVIEKIEVYFTLHRKYYLKLRQALVTDFSKQGLDLYGAH